MMGCGALDPNVRDVDVLGELTLTNAGGWKTLVSYEAPSSEKVCICGFGQNASASGDYQTLEWRLVVNGEIRQWYPSIAQVGSLLPSNMSDLNIWLLPGQKVSVEVTDNVATTVIARLKGIRMGDTYKWPPA